MARGLYRYLAQERVIFGAAAAEAVAEEATRRGARRVFLVAGKSISRKTPLVRGIADALGSRCAGLFDECVEHTPRETVVAAADAMRSAGTDLAVAIGGGTVVDTVKVALICLAHDVTEPAALDAWHIRVAADGKAEVPAAAPPPFRQIAVPTTLSGAEFSDLAGCTDTVRRMKHVYSGSEIGAAAVILDPEATLFTPERLWLSTGIRAVDHAVESICSTEAQPYTDATCTEGLRLLATALPRSKADPGDLRARLDCQLGVWLASSGINRVEFGASHGLGHVLGGVLGIPHGITSCVLLPAVLRYNAAVLAPERCARLAAALGGDPADAVERLVGSLGLPTRIRELGVTEGRLAELPAKALATRWVRTNPRPIDTEEQAMEILRAAF
jgi:alcohol dehydrogenase class IV